MLKITKNTIDLKLKKMGKNLNNISSVMNKISVDMKKKTLERFEKEKDPNGKKWKEHSKNTKAAREYYAAHTKTGDLKRRPTNPGNKILQSSGKLKRSIKSKNGSDYAKVYTDSPYAMVHNYGATNIRIKPKARISKKTSI